MFLEFLPVESDHHEDTPSQEVLGYRGCMASIRLRLWQAWTLHPSQVTIAKRVFSPDVAEVKFALKILAAMPHGLDYSLTLHAPTASGSLASTTRIAWARRRSARHRTTGTGCVQ